MKLPDLQDTEGDIFSELVAAIYQLDGDYVQQNIILKDFSEILEIDILATKYFKNKIINTLIEAKSGSWGFSDLFKLKGQMDFLGFNNAILTVKGTKSDKNKDDTKYSEKATNFYKNKAPEIGVDLKIFTSNNEFNLDEVWISFNNNKAINSIDLDYWRYSYRLSSSLIGKKFDKKESYLQLLKRKYPNTQSLTIISNYVDELSNSIFFLKSNTNRLNALYDLYGKHPRLSAIAANELFKGIYDNMAYSIENSFYKEAYYEYKNNILILTNYIEYISRINILKYATDLIIEEDFSKINIKDSVKKKEPSNFLELFFSDSITSNSKEWLPQSFLTGMKALKKHKYFHLYPVFWQWFLWIFGGFYVEELKDKEFQLLSEKTGIPESEIENALSVFDIIFPTKEGWFKSVNRFKYLKLFPICFTGFGIYYRISNYDNLFLEKYCNSNIMKSADAVVQAIDRNWENNAA